MSKAAKSIAIVGTAPSSRMLAPWGNPDIEIWACSPDNAGGVLPRITRFFEVHGDLGFADAQAWEPSYIDWLNRQVALGTFELIAQDHRVFPKATLLPVERLLAQFGRLFFSSTPAWMMAMAISEGVKEIGLFGLDMASKHEYALQRPGMHHFIELAEQKYGVQVYAPLECDILQPAPLYGFDLSTPYGRKLEVRRKEIVGRIREIDARIEQDKSDRIFLAGALDDIDYHQSIWTAERDPALGRPVPMERDPKIVNLKGD